MKKQSLFALLLLGAVLTSCGVVTDDDTSTSSSTTSESSSSSESQTTESPSSEPSSSSSSSSSGGGEVKMNHYIFHYEAVDSTCTEPGQLETWFCNNENKIYLEKPDCGTVLEGSGVIAHQGDINYVAPKAHHLLH